jgi:tetratricopeptide (TPR) repeat protein
VVGDYAAAEPLFRESLAIRREVFGDRSVWAVHSFGHVGDTLFELGRIEAAQAIYEEGLAARLALRPAMDAALDDGTEMLTIYRDMQTFGQEAWLRNGIAQCLLELGRPDEALARATMTADVELPDDRHHPDLVGRIDMRGQVLLALGRPAEALAHFEGALTRLDAGYPGGARYTAWTLVGLGVARLELGQAGDAVAPLERATAFLAATPHAHLRLQGRAHFALARAMWEIGRLAPARESARAAIAALARVPAPASERAAVEAWLAAHQ